MCRISVVTSVYNCEEYIAETIQSVINQTYTDWEFIIINDCSKDRSAEIIKSFKDDRIRFFDNKQNQGQCNNLNFGISQARGEYIARLDHDDICHPERFEKQIEYMDKHDDVVLCGSWLDNLEGGKTVKLERPPINGHHEVKFSLCFANFCTPHSSFMIRKSAMVNNNIWYGNFMFAEDYDLLTRLLKVGNIDYIPESLILYRIFPEQCTQTYSDELKLGEVYGIQGRYIDSLDIEDMDKDILKKAVTENMTTGKDYQRFQAAFIKYAACCDINVEKKELRENKCMKQIYRHVCCKQKYNTALLKNYIFSPFGDRNWLLTSNGIEFIIKCIIRYHH